MIRILVLFTFLTLRFVFFSQCSVLSSNGYSVNVSICPSQVLVSTTDCPWGYNYNLRFNYNISFSGPNQPAQLFTLQTEVNCNGQINGFYDLPKSGGVGTAVTVTNPAINHTGTAYSYGANPSCTQANLQNLGCNSLNLIIQGPGIPYQVVNCNCAAIALPVEFVSMDYSTLNGKTNIQWLLASEFNNESFTLSKSRDGISWESIETIKSLGNTTSNRTYTKTLADELVGNWYVKLAQTDKDGRYNELGLVYVENEAPKLVIAPNPMVGNVVNVYFNGLNEDQNAEIRFFSNTGQIAKTIQVQFKEGTASIETPSENGYYFIEIWQSNRCIARERVVRSAN